jgi:hypothetical protein
VPCCPLFLDPFTCSGTLQDDFGLHLLGCHCAIFPSRQLDPIGLTTTRNSDTLKPAWCDPLIQVPTTVAGDSQLSLTKLASRSTKKERNPLPRTPRTTEPGSRA